jgi:hypothetical protein
MRLYEAAVACRLYSAFGGEFDDSTVNLRSSTGAPLISNRMSAAQPS